MKSIDRISKPCTFYYESESGEKVPFELTEGFPTKKWHAQHLKQAIVQESICFGSRPGKDLWIVRLLKWLLYRCPDSWKKPTPAMTSGTTINGAFPIVKYLVEKRGWSFNEACILYGDCCERCSNWLAFEAERKNPLKEDPNYFGGRCITHCRYCKEIDPIYNHKYITWRLYRALNQKHDIKEVWRELREHI